jgi:serine/threonine protein phosphatase 1
MNRVIAIGDIHGCLAALHALVRLIAPRSCDTIITLGDYVSRGPDGRGVIDELIQLREQCRLVSLLGNHDDMLLANRAARTIVPGGPLSDPDNGLEYFADHHFDWLESCVLYHETDTHFFVHANYDPTMDLPSQDRYTLLWVSLHDAMPQPHRSGKTAVVGHTSQRDGQILDRRHLKCIDTYCYGGGWLTALDITAGTVWQVDRDGNPR